MKTIKILTVFVLVVISLSTSFIPVGASSDEAILYGMTKSDMIEYGYVFDEDGSSFCLPFGIVPPEAYFPSMMLVSEPKYPSFNPSKLPWSDAPSAVQDILSMTTDKANTTDLASYEMPFVAVRINSSNITVFVGINCYIGVADSTYNARVCTAAGGYYPTNFKSCCYTAVFNTNCTIKTDWRQVKADEWGDTGKVMTYSSATFIGDDYKVDLYVYGGNGARVNLDTGSPSSVSFKSTSSTNVYCYTNNSMGFTSSANVLWGSAASHFPYVYVSLFNPPTIKEMEQETQKGIWASIKELPTKIADSIKGFFTSLGDRISGFFDNLKNYLLYFQSEKPEHVDPFEGILTDVQDFFNSQMDDTTEFKDSLNSTFDNVKNYISTGSSVINKLLDGVPLLNAFLIFFVVIAVIRKVVGR